MEHLRINPDFVARELEDELVLLHCPTGKLFTLSRTAAILWYHCDGTKNEAGILAEFAALFPEVDRGTLRRDVETTLALFREQAIVLAAGAGTP